MASPSPAGSPSPSAGGSPFFPPLRGSRMHRDSGGGGGDDSGPATGAPATARDIPQTLWNLQIPLFITHVSQQPGAGAAPFITTVPRFGYLALLLPRLSAYYGTPCSSFHHEEVQLRNLAAGLLVDLYQPALPWRLVVGDGPEWDIADTFMNSAKEADFVRNGNAKQIMSLSKEHTTSLWNAVQDNDYASFVRVHSRLLNAPTALKNVPIRIYIPSSPLNPDEISQGSFKVMQTLVPPRMPNRTPQTLGAALRTILPPLFPSSRDPVLANVILHGASVPFQAPLEDLMREAAYPDGWLCLIVVLL